MGEGGIIVEGIDQFEGVFSQFRDSFVIIGGAACRAVLSDGPVTPRKTTDIDMVLVLEKLDRAFLSGILSRPVDTDVLKERIRMEIQSMCCIVLWMGKSGILPK